MSWAIKGTPKTRKVTNSLALEWADMEEVPQERPLSERRLQVYERLVRQGAFRPCTWARAFCKETGATYRVNGKTTSTLFSKLDLKELQDLVVVIEEYECKTIEDVAKLYSTFDSKLQSRNTSDLNRAFASTVPALAELPITTINLFVGAIAFDKIGAAYFAVPPAERAEMLLDETNFVIWGSNLLHGYDSKFLRRIPVIAAMLGTYRKDKKIAKIFWEAVRDQSDPKPDTPARKLAKYLMIKVTRGGIRDTVNVAGPREFYVKCIHAWNAFRREENTALKYHKDAPTPDFV